MQDSVWRFSHYDFYKQGTLVRAHVKDLAGRESIFLPCSTERQNEPKNRNFVGYLFWQREPSGGTIQLGVNLVGEEIHIRNTPDEFEAPEQCLRVCLSACEDKAQLGDRAHPFPGGPTSKRTIKAEPQNTFNPSQDPAFVTDPDVLAALRT